MATTKFGMLLSRLLHDAGKSQQWLAGRMKVDEAIISNFNTTDRLPKQEETVYKHMSAMFTHLISEHVVTEDQARELVRLVPFKNNETHDAKRFRKELESEISELLEKQRELDKPKYYTRHTEFIGRANDIDMIVKKLIFPDERMRVITLVGFPGVGKTELAEQIINLPQITSVFSPIFFCPIEQSGLSMATVLASISKRIEEAKLENSARLLLVIDNCELIEDMVQARQAFKSFLNSHNKLILLAVSRKRLNLGEQIEYVHQVNPLRVPKKTDESIENWQTYPSVELLQQATENSTKNAKKPFCLTEQNKEDVITICHALGGLPLALLIAAGAIGRAGIEKVIEWIESKEFTDIPNTSHDDISHETLNALIEKSYQLLTKDEQKLFRRLAIFKGSNRIEAVGSICTRDLSLSEPQIDGLLLTLKNHSLISYENGWVRIAHNTIYDIARKKLTDKKGGADEMNLIASFYCRFYYLSVMDYMLRRYSVLAEYGMERSLEALDVDYRALPRYQEFEKALEELEEHYEILQQYIRDIRQTDEYIAEINIFYVENELKKRFGEEAYSHYEQTAQEIRQAMEARGDANPTAEEELKLLNAGQWFPATRKQIWLEDELPFPLLLWKSFLGETLNSDGFYKWEILLMNFNDGIDAYNDALYGG